MVLRPLRTAVCHCAGSTRARSRAPSTTVTSLGERSSTIVRICAVSANEMNSTDRIARGPVPLVQPLDHQLPMALDRPEVAATLHLEDVTHRLDLVRPGHGVRDALARELVVVVAEHALDVRGARLHGADVQADGWRGHEALPVPTGASCSRPILRSSAVMARTPTSTTASSLTSTPSTDASGDSRSARSPCSLHRDGRQGSGRSRGSVRAAHAWSSGDSTMGPDCSERGSTRWARNCLT